MVEVLRRFPVGRDPGHQVAVRFAEQVFINIKLSRIEVIKMTIGEIAQQKVSFLDAAMPAPELEALAADLDAFTFVNFRFVKTRCVKSAHDLFCPFRDSVFAIPRSSAMFILVYRISTGK